MSFSKRFKLLLTLAFFASGCAVVGAVRGGVELNKLWGIALPAERAANARRIASNEFQDKVQPILNNRCAVCHSCYDAPCGLKLNSYEGLERGGHGESAYANRLLKADPMRLFIDGHVPEDWRKKGFHPVLNERAQNVTANLEGGVLARILDLKTRYPLSKEDVAIEGFDFSLNRKQQCPKIENFELYAKSFPFWGMPYGLPALSQEEHDILIDWLARGASYSEAEAIDPRSQKEINSWESFLNGSSLKQQLMSRYLYEHLFLAHIYFDSVDEKTFFELVRSKTPSGEAVQRIATRRPFDHPGVDKVYYRFVPIKSAIAAKRHMPYAFNAKRIARYKKLFLLPRYTVSSLPSYEIEEASNPFVTFQDIPAISRYKFLLDEAQFSIMNFIKGPVCRGQVALNVIRDKFWVFFVNPDLEIIEKGYSRIVEDNAETLALPAADGSNSLAVDSWIHYASLQIENLKAKAKFLEEVYAKHLANLNIIWDGDGRNDNAGLTIFRHFDNASVVKGLVGDEPKTVWILSFSELERIHYLLVAGFDIYGNVGHQLNTRLYMDFLRMEGEFNFLGLLPKETRQKVSDDWYEDSSWYVKEFISKSLLMDSRDTNISFSSNAPKEELLAKIKTRLSPALNSRYDLENIKDAHVRRLMRKLNSFRGEKVSILPQLAFLKVPGVGFFSLINDSEHKNISKLFREARDPSGDSLTVVPGFLGVHPNAFYVVERSELIEFVNAVLSLEDEASYGSLLDSYGMRRNNPNFWALSDELHQSFQSLAGVESGLFDYNRYENR